MHERNQRLLCRLGFLLLCVFPTSISLAWIAYARTDHYDAANAKVWQARLSEWTGWHVAIHRVRHPRPDVTLLEDITWSDSETELPIGHVRMIEITHGRDRVTVVASQPAVASDQLPNLVRMVHERLLRRLPTGGAVLDLAAWELTIEDPGGGTTLTDVRCLVETGGREARLSADFRIAGLDMNDTASVRVTRRRTQSPSTTWELHTGAASLPCSTVAALFPWVDELAADGLFRGSASATDSPRGWQGEFSGQFSGLDLDRLVSHRFPHKLSGSAELVVELGRFDANRLVLLDALLVSRGGQLSRSLVDGAVRELRLRRAASLPDTSIRYVAYDQLAFRITLDERGVTLHGACFEQPPRTVLAGPGGPLLFDSDDRFTSTAALVRLLASANDHQVPATRESAALFQVLPLPPLVREKEGDGANGYVPLRLGPR